MGDDVSLGNIALNIVGIAISAALPLLILRYFKIRDNARDERQRDAKEAVEKNSEELKRLTKDSAAQQRETTLHMIKEFEKKFEDQSSKVADEIKHEKEIAHKQMMLEIKENILTSHNDLGKKIDEVNNKQLEMKRNQESMIGNLQNRADMVNGNVAVIRDEILDLQEDLDDLYERMDTPTPTEKRERKRKRRKKRQEIATDAQSQDIIKKKLLN